MELDPTSAAGKQVIESYGAGRFRVSGAIHDGSVIVLPDRTLAWPPTGFEGLAPESFADVIAAADGIDILLLGCGPRMCLVPERLRGPLRAAGLVGAPMATGPACRPFPCLPGMVKEAGWEK